jgi:protein-S-isoprenylcysteine O-methyltransferase Ste14
MTISASTPRLRASLLWFLALIGLTALTRALPLHPTVTTALDVGGLLLVAIACLGRIWCSVFIAGRKDIELVTAGPYALCRHPLYTLSMIGALGLGLATRSLVLTSATLLVLGALLLRAAAAEDRFLAARFDERFDAYRASTPAFWPRRWPRHWRPPSSTPVQVRPDILWKAFVDAWAFFLLFTVVFAARRWSELGVLPAPLLLP